LSLSPQTGDYKLKTADCQLQTANCQLATASGPTPFQPFRKLAVNMQAHIKTHHNDNDNDNDAQRFVVLQENYVLLARRRTLR